MAFKLPTIQTEVKTGAESQVTFPVKSAPGTVKGELLVCKLLIFTTGRTFGVGKWTQGEGSPISITGGEMAYFTMVATESGEHEYPIKVEGIGAAVSGSWAVWRISGQNASTPIVGHAFQSGTSSTTIKFGTATQSVNSKVLDVLFNVSAAEETMTKPTGFTTVNGESKSSFHAFSREWPEQKATGETSTTQGSATGYVSLRLLFLGEEEAGGKTVEGKAAGTGAGSGAAKGIRERTGKASGAGTGSGTAKGLRTTLAKAAGSGTGSGTAKGQRVVSGFAAGAGTGTGSASGVRIASTSAQGSGTGSGSAAGVRIASGAASGSGNGSGTASGTVIAHGVVEGSAAGEGTGSGSASGIRTSLGSASGAGQGSGSAGGLRTIFGAASGTGTGTGSAKGVVIAPGAVTVDLPTDLILAASDHTVVLSSHVSPAGVLAGQAPGVTLAARAPSLTLAPLPEQSIVLDSTETEVVLDG